MIQTPEIRQSTRDYYTALNNARQRLFAGQGRPQVAVGMFKQVLADTIIRINNDFQSGTITADRADALIRQINARLNQMGQRFNIILDNQVKRSMNLAVEAHRRGTIAAFDTEDVAMDLNVLWDRVPEKALEAMNVKRGLSTRYDYRTLMKRRITGMQREVDDFVQTVVARGANADRASKELATMMAREDDQVKRILARNNVDLDPDAVRQAFDSGGLSKGDYKQINELLYDARRIVVSETNTGFREADTVASYHSPVVGYLRWTTSGRHDGLHSSPDICDIYEDTDQFGLGPGVYPIENFPASAHPFCGCYSQKVFREPQDWDKPTPPAQEPPTLTTDQFQGMFSDRTDRYLEKQVELANHWNREAYRYASGEGFGLD